MDNIILKYTSLEEFNKKFIQDLKFFHIGDDCVLTAEVKSGKKEEPISLKVKRITRP